MIAEGNAIDEKQKEDEGKEKELSKNQIKKIQKADAWKQKAAEIKLKKKAIHKEKKKLQKKVIKQKIEDGVDVGEDELKKISRPRRGRGFRADMKEKLTKAPIVIIDCSFDEHHGERELISMARQLEYAINVNKQVAQPLRLLVSGLSDRFRRILDKRYASLTQQLPELAGRLPRPGRPLAAV